MSESFGARLAAAVAARGPLCVGIDPHPGLLRQWDLDDNVAGLARFAATTVEALAGEVAVLKPQSAFFERFGSRGIAVLERTVADARAAGAIVLLDVKRGDVGSTVTAYAQAYLDPSAPLAADAVTASPFLGYGSLGPLVQAAHDHGGGVFVLARTSNAEGETVQQARGADGRTVAQQIVDAAAGDNANHNHVKHNNAAADNASHNNAAADNAAADNAAVRRTAVRLGPVGVVVGATLDRIELDLTVLRGPILVTGLGAQGGTAADIARLFAGLPGVLPSTSRGVLAAGPDHAALRTAARRQLDDLIAAGVR